MGMKKLPFLIKTGASLSIVGTAILIVFAFVLLVFPVSKVCPSNSTECEYVSEAPFPFRIMINPYMLVISLSIIACGVCFFRFGCWYLNKSRRNEEHSNPY
jgi:NADH:ubiquinone oxidoreductase subunit 5 (subunit L)/multisubunit Na+/H+ antiporter MnhA subunit